MENKFVGAEQNNKTKSSKFFLFIFEKIK